MSFYSVIVCGGRDYTDRTKVFSTLDDLKAKYGPLHIIQGGATGADDLAFQWANRQAYMHVSNVPADWKTHGRAAGPIRNQRMIDEYGPKLVVVFPGGRGTADMVRRARDAQIPVLEIKPGMQKSLERVE